MLLPDPHLFSNFCDISIGENCSNRAGLLVLVAKILTGKRLPRTKKGDNVRQVSAAFEFRIPSDYAQLEILQYDNILISTNTIYHNIVE